MGTKSMLLRLAPAAALLALAACGAGENFGGSAGTPVDADSESAPPDDRVFEGLVTVIETPEHGPQLAGALAESYPPQGGGMDVTGWDWEAVAHESAQGTSWGEYLVTGTFDGESFALTEDPVPASEIDPGDYRDQGGPDVPEPDEPLSEADMEQISDELAERFPGTIVGSWPDAERGVLHIDAVLVPAALEDYVAENYAEGTVVMSAMLEPVSQ